MINLNFLLFLFFVLLNTIKFFLFHIKISNGNLSFFLFLFFSTFLFYFLIFSLNSKFFLVLFYIFQFLYLGINFTYFNYFKIHLTLKTFQLLFREGIITFFKGSYPFYPFIFFFLIDFPLLILFLFRINLKTLIKIDKKLKAILILISISYIFLYTKESIYRSKLRERLYDFRGDFRILENFGLLPWQIKGLFEEKKEIELKESKNFLEERGREKLYNLIFIQVESLDSFILNEEYSRKKIMPYLNKILSKSIYYPYVISYHYGGGTSDCEFTIFNSIEPLLNYPAIKILDYHYRNSFVHLLKKNGYKTFAFHGNRGDFWNRDYALKAIGFDEFFDIKKMKLKMEGWGAKDEDVFEFVLDMIKKEKSPFFYYIITMSSHVPFRNVFKYYKNENFEGIEEYVVKNYFTSMAYVDFVLEKYIKEFLKLKDTFLFIYGDHVGIEEAEKYKGSTIKIEDLKIDFVPLIILTPHNDFYKEEKLAGSFLDFAPTALYCSGIPFKYFTDGKNLIKYPVEDDFISPFFKKYKRSFLYDKIQEKYLATKKK